MTRLLEISVLFLLTTAQLLDEGPTLRLHCGDVPVLSIAQGPASLPQTANSTFYVSFEPGALGSPETMARVQQIVGCPLTSYVPDDSFVVFLQNSIALELEGQSFVRAVKVVPAEHKVSPSIQEGLSSRVEIVAVLSPSCLPHEEAELNHLLLQVSRNCSDSSLCRIAAHSSRLVVSVNRDDVSNAVQVLSASSFVYWIEKKAEMLPFPQTIQNFPN
jgi:hypothetical protein